MNIMNKKHFIILLSFLGLFSCKDEVMPPEVEVPQQSEAVAEKLEQYNADIAALQYVSEGQATVVALTEDGKVSLDNGMQLALLSRVETDADIPAFGIDEEGYWRYILDGDTIGLTDLVGNAVPALEKASQGTFTPQVAISEDGYWQVSLNGYQWKKLSDKLAPSLNDKAAESYALFKSTSTTDGILTAEPFIGSAITLELPADNMAEAWRRFLMNTDDNVLLDYSYAGYMRGEVAPPDGFAWGYEVVNVKDYMEGNGIKSARLALNKILYERGMVRTCPGESYKSTTKPQANVVIYFPEGQYDLQTGTEEADGYVWTNNKGDEYHTFPEIYAGNFIIKGDGKGKTILNMACKGFDGTKDGLDDLPKAVYGSTMLSIKHTNSPYNTDNSKLYAKVVENAKKGDFTVSVQMASGMDLKSGDWVQLRLRSNDDALLRAEMGPLYEWGKTYMPKQSGNNGKGLSIFQTPGYTSGATEDNNGVKIVEFHQVKSVSSSKVVFYEPIMSDINVGHDDHGGWEIRGFMHFENVGVEDLTFVGNAVSPYAHHGEELGLGNDVTWVYDEGFKPLSFTRVVNSWVRNVGFESVSEAMTFGESANCSAYNIEITGVRGHSAVRAAGSSRVFIGKVSDKSQDKSANGTYAIGDGQWHGSGVSKPGIGNVIYASNWGTNACFESHATQPRATLFDNCTGGLVRYHAGGSDIEAPNHLRDLTIWNLNVTGTTDEKHVEYESNFKWWDADNIWWKVYPPIVIGTYGKAVTFSKEEGQLTYEESTGAKVSPESLYEAQLKKRLGYVPAWLNALK